MAKQPEHLGGMQATQTVVAPAIHMNGTSADALIDNLQRVYSLLGDSHDALEQAAPNRRDYYAADGLWEAALEQHRNRMLAIDGLRKSIEDEIGLIYDQQ